MGQFSQPRVYPNLNPSAAVPVDREQIFSLSSFADIYRMRKGREHGQYVPNAKFTFVKLLDGQTLMHQRFRHPVLSEGRPVLYAGEAFFNNGRLQWWSNGSGNYRPDPDHAAQSGLPTRQFFTHEQVLKGEHTRSPEVPARAGRPGGLAEAMRSGAQPAGIQTKGIQTKSIQTKSIETKSIETKNIQTKNIEAKIIEAKIISAWPGSPVAGDLRRAPATAPTAWPARFQARLP